MSAPVCSSRVRRIALAVGTALWLAATTGCGPEAPPCDEVGIVCRVAGNGVASFDGDGKAAVDSGLYLPSTVRVGPDGLLYVMDFNNHRLRRIEPDETLQTVVGTGIHAVAVEGALARSTPLENPIDFAFDSSGAVVLVGYHDPRVLKVALDGRIEVLAGTGSVGDGGDDGPALEATFTQISALAVGPDGRVAVCDDLTHRVRVLVDGSVVALAGVSGEAGYSGDGGSAMEAQLDSPRGIAFDDAGNLFVADTGNHRIRRIDPSGVITTVIGNGDPAFSGDGGPALDASLHAPTGVSIAEDGSLLVADSGNHRIRRVESDGTIRTVAGTDAGFSGDGGPATEAKLSSPSHAFESNGTVYIADQRNHVVRAVRLR